jgi:TonB family protein
MRRVRWKIGWLLAALVVVPVQADEDVDRLIAYMLSELEATQIACSEVQQSEYPGKRVVCASYDDSFSAMKSDWDLILRHTKLPLRISTDSAWTFNDDSFRITYSHSGGREIHVAHQTTLNQLHFAYLEKETADPSQSVRAASGGALDTGKPPPPRVAGFGGVSLPVLIEDSRVEPFRSPRAREERVAGTVTLEIVVQGDGSVRNVVVLSASPEGYDFDVSALEAVRQWTFEPALFEDQAVDSVLNLTIDIKQDPPTPSDD